jgi:phosphoribosylaminoimidazole-succinocarboxamide synthase
VKRTVARRRQIYEGKAKILYEGPEPGTLIQYFKDDATAFNAQKRGTISGKGVINNRISEHIFTALQTIGVPTHFIRRLNMREQLIRQVEIIPIEVVVRNVAAGSLSKRLGIEEGTQLPRTIIEYYYKDDALGDPMIADEHIACFGWATQEEMNDIADMAIRVNDFLSGMFAAIGIRVIDFKLEFGRVWDGEYSRVILADEISPDGCRLWDMKTNEKLDKDRFRQDLGELRKPIRKSPDAWVCSNLMRILPFSTSTLTVRSAAARNIRSAAISAGGSELAHLGLTAEDCFWCPDHLHFGKVAPRSTQHCLGIKGRSSTPNGRSGCQGHHPTRFRTECNAPVSSH